MEQAAATCDDARVLQRLARDHWVRMHGSPRLSVLVGEPGTHALWQRWAALMKLADAMLVHVPDDDTAVTVVARAIHRSLDMPTRAIGVAVSARTLDAVRMRLDDRSRTLIDEGVVVVGATVDAAGSSSPRGKTAGYGPDAEPVTNRDARSIAEAMLFEALEMKPATRGRFELNGYLSVRFGPDAAEVDLLNRQDQIAVEIDGYHHFTDAEAYRRDRRKDLLLQTQGLLVVRVLAEDVIRDPSAAVTLICQAIASRMGAP